MPVLIEDYALVGDLHTAALISRDGSIDWLCLPRFDSEACFAALLGDERNGHWQIAPATGVSRVRRRYRPGTWCWRPSSPPPRVPSGWLTACRFAAPTRC